VHWHADPGPGQGAHGDGDQAAGTDPFAILNFGFPLFDFEF
jgi:hypothetical protein